MLTELPRTVAAPAPPAVDPGEPMIRRALRFLPGVLVLAVASVVLDRYGVGWDVQVRFAGHLSGVVLLPGVLVWRALRGRSGTLPSDLVGGVALGYAMEIGWYLAGRAAGFPYLHVVAAGVVVLAFLAVPRLRRHWRGRGRPTDIRWAWSVAVLCLSMVAWAAASYFGPHELTWPGAGNPYQDMVFHQALVAELRHHLPAQMPYVDGVPLSYHWFVHADWAAASWSTGIEPFLLTYRLGLVPAAVLIVVAIAAVAQRIAPGRWWSGPLAAALALFALPRHAAGAAMGQAADIPATMWLSPSQTFGGLLFAGAVLALADLLRPEDPERRPSAGRWVAFALVVAGATGGKATYAPLLLAGLGAVVAVGLLRRRFERRAVAAAVLTLVAFGIAMRTMFPGTSGGLFLDPLASARGAAPGWTVGHVLAIWALGWAAVLGAGVVLLFRRGWRDPMLVLCAGIGAAALGLVLLTQQSGGSQMYFLVSARPYMAVLVVAALVAVAPGAAMGRWTGWLVIPATLAGVAAALYSRDIVGDLPTDGTVAVLWPYAVPLLTAVALGLLLAVLRRSRPLALVAAGAVLIGAVLPSIAPTVENTVLTRETQTGVPPKASAKWRPVIPPGAPEAGRWLRANTAVGDLLATNNHCRHAAAVCDPRQFWLAAFSERRVLVEGWSYTPAANEIAVRNELSSNRVPYWDPARLVENDSAFLYPSPETVGLLRARYGVDWLVVDIRRRYDPAKLGQFAELRYQVGTISIYQIR